MNSRIAAILLPFLLLTSGVPAQTGQQAPFQAPALLLEKSGSTTNAWLVAATKSSIRYRETEVASSTIDARISDYQSIYIFEPREYAEAMNLYQAGKYQEARELFAAVKDRFKPIQALPDSPGALAAFYEMECLRKLGDLDGLAAALQKFDKDPLTRETQLGQIELYVLWEAVRTKDWNRVEILANQRAKTRLPGDQRAQVAYCHGLALEGLERPDEALTAYQTAMTADAGASEDIARAAALRILSILKADAGVVNAIKDWGTKQENKNSGGYAKLLEASAVATLFEMLLGAETPLPAEFKDLLKYRPAPQEPGKPAKAGK